MLRWLLVSLMVGPLAPTLARGHDLWLIPPTGAAPGSTIQVKAHSGMDFPVSESAPNVEKFLARRVIRPDGTESTARAAPTAGTSGVMEFTVEKLGLHVLAVQTAPRVLEMSAGDFNHYLVADGLPHIYLLRHKDNMLDKPAKERYSKSPKCLVFAGDGPGDATRPVGLTLEIIPRVDPRRVTPGGALPVRVLFRNQPLADANLGWDIPGDGPAFTGTARTNSKGEALIPIAQDGLMTIRLTHMTRPADTEAEWESFWTTLTWHVPPK